MPRGLVLLFACACYAPRVPTGSPCDADRPCPTPLVCSTTTWTCELGAADAAAATDDAADDAAIAVDAALGAFSTPVRIAELSSGAPDDDLTLTADQLEIYFESSRSGGPGGPNLWAATRPSTADPWSAPALVTELNSGSADSSPEISGDGLTIYFCSDRPGGQAWDLYRATRPDRTTPWTTPVRVVDLSSAGNDCAAVESQDRLEVILHRGFPSRNLYRATRASVGDAWQAPVGIAELNTAGDDGSPFLARGDLDLWFNVDPANTGLADLAVATRPALDQPFAAPVVVSELSSAADDADPWISPDLRTIYFVSDRAGSHDLYVATR